MDAGQTLLENGGEVFRAQQTMEIMAASLGVRDFHVYVLTNGIFASAHLPGRDAVSLVRHVPTVSVHLGRVEAVNEMVKDIIAKFGKIDILINNAGITNDSTLKKMTVEQWQNVIDVNLSGTFYCCKAVLNYMLEAGYGRIVNASSVVGLYGNFGQTNYVATKAGLIGMTKTMARELGRKGITVNAVAPGFIETEMVAKMPENVLDGMRAKVPVGRLGRPEEIAAAYLYLASDEAAYVNGAVLSVDGGMTV